MPGVRVAGDLLERDFTAQAPNERWVADITYLRSWEGWLYLVAVQDLYSRRIVGWSMADHMRTELAHGDAHGAADAPGDHPAAQPLIRASTPGQRHTIANALLTQLTATLNEIDRLTATDTSTGS